MHRWIKPCDSCTLCQRLYCVYIWQFVDYVISVACYRAVIASPPTMKIGDSWLLRAHAREKNGIAQDNQDLWTNITTILNTWNKTIFLMIHACPSLDSEFRNKLEWSVLASYWYHLSHNLLITSQEALSMNLIGVSLRC